jgi:acetylornithine deacetylase/succinyl-diaminopimelate desuccinylase-like protein
VTPRRGRRATSLPRELDLDDAGWARADDEALDLLQRSIRVDTVNPPGNEIALARMLDRVLADAGIDRQLLEPAAGRAALVARLRGNGSYAPILLLAHMDVVPVQPERWSADPFGGVIRDGFLYGRGTIDDKGMLAVNLEAMLLLKRHVIDRGLALSRDVIFVATSDEEAGGEWGIDWLARHHRELIRAEYALNEGGRIRIVRGRRLYAAVQCAEKVPHVLTVTAQGKGGHAAVPRPDNAIVRLGRALAAIGAHREAVRLSPTTRRFFGGLAAIWPAPRERRAMADIASGAPARVRRGAEVLAAVPVLDAVLRNGISATMLRGGLRANVIPPAVSATLNVRTLPGRSIDGVVARLRRAVDDRNVSIEVTREGEDAPVSDHRSPMFAAVAESITSLDPRTTVVPYLSTGATDSARLRRMGVEAYGLLPFPLAQDDEDRMHAHDERVPIESLGYGVRVVYGIVRRMVR